MCCNFNVLEGFFDPGIRLGTGCRLKVSDFHQDGDQATIRLHKKGDKRRTIGLHFAAAQAIGEYIEKAEIKSGPLFRPRLNPRSKKLAQGHMDAASLYRLVQSYMMRLPGAAKEEPQADGSIGTRCLYTPPFAPGHHATLLLDSGVDIRKVQDLLGHRHITTTRIYEKRSRTTAESASHDVPI
jgi:site-specific recombinase XerD